MLQEKYPSALYRECAIVNMRILSPAMADAADAQTQAMDLEYKRASGSATYGTNTFHKLLELWRMIMNSTERRENHTEVSRSKAVPLFRYYTSVDCCLTIVYRGHLLKRLECLQQLQSQKTVPDVVVRKGDVSGNLDYVYVSLHPHCGPQSLDPMFCNSS
ncbi:hypothetical protein DFJ58DRAFT_323136 [Suillus subalutaceus]|uniref:uncharacterized protein n=1 Tax=Suillus subalutaceus TaxID=48586 RepID=UPI001B87C1D8|nr:uncharacterized protein DFJ58DRAFT_323136 [Suillus subalutaceus]KAG1874760.1 hypothetical protein DFJ58DRAFT_323136 [Suillus subalutaceus]